MNKNIAVVMIPIQNENNDIDKLTGKLVNGVFKKISNYNMKILFYSNNTNDVLKNDNTVKEYDIVHLFKNKNENFKAYMYAVNKLNADVVIELDEEYNTACENIISLLEEIDNGSDYVLGKRKLFSKLGGLIIRFLIFFPFGNFFKIKDPVSGIKALRISNIYDKLDFEKINSGKISKRIMFLHNIIETGAKVKEIPLTDVINNIKINKLETEKKSKIFKTLAGCRFRDTKTRRFFKFGITGFIGFVVNSVFLEVFARTGFTTIIANLFYFLKDIPILNILNTKGFWSAALSTELSIISNFMFNNFWTFHDKKILHPLKMILKFLQFNLTSIGAVIIIAIVVGGATMLLGKTMIVRQLSLIFSIAFLVIPYNWMMYNFIIWRKKK